jgi:Ser/Thr protein kinase RdoA (MazF antagonist)
MDGALLTLLQDRDNTTYAVELDGERRYAVRVCRPEPLRAQRAELEVAWLRALQRDTNLRVPEPHAMKVDDGNERRVCVAFRWREGSSRYAELFTPAEAHEVGRIAAVLHQHAHSWSPFRPAAPPLELDFRRRGRARFTTRENDIVDTVAGLTRSTLDTLRKRGSAWGLIHADMTPENCIVSGDRLILIDYADAKHGYFLQDIAVFFASVWFHRERESLVQSYLDGYAGVLPPPSESDLPAIETLIAARLVSQALWLASHASEPQFGELELVRARTQIAEVEMFLKKFPWRWVGKRGVHVSPENRRLQSNTE